MPALDTNALIELARTPIPGGSPCGEDIGDHVDYIFIGNELDKIGRIDLGGDPDWFQVELKALLLLREKSKDLDVALGLGLALFKTYRYAGLDAAFGVFAELITTYWDSLYPPRPRRRKSIIESFADRFTEGGWFRENVPAADDFEHLERAVERVKGVRDALTARMPDDKPQLDKFIRSLADLAALKPKPQEPASAGAAGTPGPAGGAAGSFVAGEVADSGGALSAILGAITYLRKADATDPIPYAALRVMRWSKVSLPASDAARYEIEPPDKSLVETLAHQFSQGMWDNLLKNAEAAFRSNDPLWLDLQRYVCSAMSNLGSAYERARKAVTGLTGSLVQQLGPGVFDLRFRGGAALCTGETKLWIQSEAAPAGGSSGGRSAGAGNGKLDEAYNKARNLVGSGKLKEALQELQEGLLTSTQLRDRLLWRLRIAQLCVDAQRLHLAKPLLEACHEEVSRHRIEEWEPSLAIEVVECLYRCRRGLANQEKPPSHETVQGVQDSFGWLCRLDPLAALASEPAAK